jgi:hypothetical protein
MEIFQTSGDPQYKNKRNLQGVAVVSYEEGIVLVVYSVSNLDAPQDKV